MTYFMKNIPGLELLSNVRLKYQKAFSLQLSVFGYKEHIGAEKESNIIRKIRFATASAYDSRELNNLTCENERFVFADKVYANGNIKKTMCKQGTYCSIMDKGGRGRTELLPNRKRQIT